MKKIFLLLIGWLLLFPFSQGHAEEFSSRPAITIINFVRGNGLGHETDDLVESLKAQWQVTKQQSVPATWLFQYSALEDTRMIDFAKKEMKDQEFGLMFEIDKNQANKTGIQFRGQGAWFRSDGLFLSSYDVHERRKFIDTTFSLFKKTFGYYPKTVGAWWIGGDSLTYMQKKYGITSALRASDQFNLDFYSIWGTPWNIPYLSSKENEGIPASSYDISSKVVILQWAIRDPLEGYVDPTFSLQDYAVKGYTKNYVDYLASIFLQKPNGNMVMGLENGGTLQVFQQSYQSMLTKALELQKKNNVDILLARQYADRFLVQKKVFTTRTHFLSTDYDSGDQSFWYISENYRVMIENRNGVVSLMDLRDYHYKVKEDFDVLPNSQSHLRINEPSIVDSMRTPNQRIDLQTTDESMTEKVDGDTVSLYIGERKIADFTKTVVTIYLENNTTKTFSFATKDKKTYPIELSLMIFYSLYLLILIAYKKNIKKVMYEYLPLLIPFLFAISLFPRGSTFLFDKKESILFPIVILFPYLPVTSTLFLIKILPFSVLFTLHFLLVLKYGRKRNRLLFWGYLLCLSFLYVHVPYFPLDRSTYSIVGIVFGGIAILVFVVNIYIFGRMKSKKLRILSLCISFLLLIGVAGSVVVSRSKLALTNYEIQALEVLKKEKKSIIFVEEVDYSIYPIYKAVKPLLYKNYWISKLITGKTWDVVDRPENNILSLTNYDNKYIVIPRYLGTDMSEHEITVLNLHKIFDNAHIAIFEKK